MAKVLQLFQPTKEEQHILNFRKPATEVLEGRGPALMEVPGLAGEDIDGAWEGLRRFNNEVSLEEQRRWEIWVPRDPKFDEPDDGVMKREPPKDWKLILHYRPDLEQLLLRVAGIRLTAWQQGWFAHMERIWQVCTRAHFTYAAELDKLSPGYDFERRAIWWAYLNCLRLLQYVPHPGMLATWHTDRSATTFHVAETRRGFCTRRGFLVEAHESPKAPEVLVFGGDQTEKITDFAVPSLPHAVIDTTGGTEERSAMVFFGKMYTGKL